MDMQAQISREAEEFKQITNVSRETFYLYAEWYNLLTRWNKKINLVSPNTIHNYWLRHALDSWQVVEPMLGRGKFLTSIIPATRDNSVSREGDNSGEIPDQEARSEATGKDQEARRKQSDRPGLHQVWDVRSDVDIAQVNSPPCHSSAGWNLKQEPSLNHKTLDKVQDAGQISRETAPLNVIDLGSGAGFPGLAVAIALKASENSHPDSHVTLIEANGKKCNFLRAVIRELDLPATAIAARAENVPETLKTKHFNVISARAFAPLPKLLHYSAPYWRGNEGKYKENQEARSEATGKDQEARSEATGNDQEARSEATGKDQEAVNTLGIFPKGRNWQEEVEAARKDWHFDLETHQSLTDGDAKILWVRNLVKRGA